MSLRHAKERKPAHPAPIRARSAALRLIDSDGGATARPGDVDAEDELVRADATAPRRWAATVCAARHPHSNEDRVLCDPERGVAAVFDGIGGAAGGELAARAACGAMAMALDRLPAQDRLDGRRRWLAAALESGERAIALSRRLHADAPGQGTTVIAAALAGATLLTACVGDSRAYRVRGGLLELIADEHEGVIPRPSMADLIDRVRSAEDLDSGPKDLGWAFMHRNIIGASLGDGDRATPREHQVAPGDLIVLTSDGVHDNLAHEELESILTDDAYRGPQALAAAVVRRAQQRSLEQNHVRAKDDDITCAILAVPSR